jgi:hypothetical protein
MLDVVPTLTSRMRLRFVAEDANAGSLVEAAIDDAEIFRLDCGPLACEYDFNQDENVDLSDAQLMAQVAAGLLVRDPAWLDGDLNNDENADLTDAQILASYVASGVCGV